MNWTKSRSTAYIYVQLYILCACNFLVYLRAKYSSAKYIANWKLGSLKIRIPSKPCWNVYCLSFVFTRVFVCFLDDYEREKGENSKLISRSRSLQLK